MRALNSVVGSLSLVGLIACGGGSHPQIIDVPIPPDAPIDAFACEFMAGANIDTTGKDIDFSTPAPALILNANPNMATPPALEFSVVITFMSHPGAGILMVWADKVGAFGTAVAGNMNKPPTAGSYPMDADATIGAGFDIVNGITDNGDGTVSIKPTQVYTLANNPTAQFVLTTWSSAAAANTTTTNITGAYTGAMFSGGNVDAQGNLTPNGCAMMVTRLGWLKLGVKWPATLPKPGNPSEKPTDAPRDWSQYTHVPAIQVDL
jgi:hypothetical protein